MAKAKKKEEFSVIDNLIAGVLLASAGGFAAMIGLGAIHAEFGVGAAPGYVATTGIFTAAAYALRIFTALSRGIK